MSFAEILDEIPRLSFAERQELVRRAVALNDSEMTAEENTLLDARTEDFLRNQAGLEEWRGRSYSPEAQTIVATATAEAARLRAEGISREQTFRGIARGARGNRQTPLRHAGHGREKRCGDPGVAYEKHP
jgi:hypothetical protein